MSNTINARFVGIVAAIFVVGILFCGIFLIYQSHQQYQESIDLTNVMIKDTVKPRLSLMPNFTVVKEGYGQALLYFMLALGAALLVVLLPRLSNINIGPGGISVGLKDLPQKVQELSSQLNAIQSVSAGAGGIKKGADLAIARAPGIGGQDKSAVPGDPQKGRWGGLAERNEKRLGASIIDSDLPGFFTVILTVEGIDLTKPLTGVVHFHLHPSFANPNPVITVQNNKAVLKLTRVYGAFTVGAEADNGQTRLELDLATVAGAPAEFR